MADGIIPIRDANLALKQRRIMDEGGTGITPYNAEHPDQRAALIAALGSLGVYAPSSLAAVTTALSAAGQSGAFTPILGRPFNVTHKPSTDFAGSYQLERKFTGDAAWYAVLKYTDLVDLPETFSLTETESGVTYRWNMTVRTAGSVNVRISA
jgi:hypothetical protein